MEAPETFTRYDSADYLKTPEDVTEYLIAAIEEGGDDPAYMADVVSVAVRALRGMTKIAKDTNIVEEKTSELSRKESA